MAAVAVAAAPCPTAVREAPLPTGNIPTPKKGAPDKHRLLALVAARGDPARRARAGRPRQRVAAPADRGVRRHVHRARRRWSIFSTFINAPLRELANPNLTPNPSKAPWYFLGLQELLRYFHPMIAGIIIPTFILVGLAAIPYVDRNPSIKPGDRKVAITLFTMLFMFGATLTIIGSFFRGPGYNWVWPWTQGVFFEL